ncbi:MAG: hypothetical protein H6716_22830 [Polyangiaceae bacterium]|nr:hypothetical protein [Polyangiaceae bacterium]
MATDQKIRALVEDFVAQLSEEIRSSAMDAVADALKVTTPARRGPGRPRKAAGAKAGRKTTRKAARKAGRKTGRRKAAKISTDQLLAAIKKHNGERTEVIANDLGVSSKVFKPQLDELIAAGTVKRKGKARGSTLHV